VLRRRRRVAFHAAPRTTATGRRELLALVLAAVAITVFFAGISVVAL